MTEGDNGLHQGIEVVGGPSIKFLLEPGPRSWSIGGGEDKWEKGFLDIKEEESFDLCERCSL